MQFSTPAGAKKRGRTVYGNFYTNLYKQFFPRPFLVCVKKLFCSTPERLLCNNFKGEKETCEIKSRMREQKIYHTCWEYRYVIFHLLQNTFQLWNISALLQTE